MSHLVNDVLLRVDLVPEIDRNISENDADPVGDPADAPVSMIDYGGRHAVCQT
jgi:hypothetical protein